MNKIPLNIQRFADGKVVINTELNTKNFENGLNKIKNTSQKAGSTIKNIVAGLGVAKAVSLAMSQISTSIDGAVKRVDTLNNFPKVMSNLGISTAEADKSIKKMSDRLTGLPTTLDQGASAVQRFTSKNGDVAKSTDLFLALNNAILAGGASSEIQASALEQLSQSYAKGKPDMMEWRTAMTAMPAQLKQVAQAMGYVNADELGEALRNGTVSMDEFMQKMVELNTKGIDGFASFEEQARNSTGGIQTSITVAKTQIVKGVADIVNALDQSFQNTQFGSLSGLIQKVGEKAKEILDKIAEYIPNIVNNLDKIIPMIGLLSVGFSTINLDGINSVSSALGGLVGKVNSSAGLITKIVSSGFGFAALGGLVLVAMGLAEDNFGDSINKMLDTAAKKGPEIITKLGEGLISKLPDLMQKGTELLSKLIDTINANLPAILTVGMQIITQLIIGFAKALPTLIPQIINTILIITETLIDNIDLIIDAGIQLILGLAEGLISALPILIDKIPILIEKLLNAIIENLPKIIEMGITLIIKLAEGLLKAIPQLISKIPVILNSLNEAIKMGFVTMLKLGGELIIKLAKGIGDNIIKIVTKGAEIVSAIKKNLSKLPQLALQWGKDMIQGMINGIKKMIGKVGDTVKGVADKIKSFLHFSRPDEGPLRDYETWMPDMIKGLALTMKKSSNILTKQSEDLAEQIKDSMNFSDIYSDMEKAINVENAKIQSNVETGKVFNSLVNTTPIQIDLDADVEMDNQKVGRIIAPTVSRTIKTGGGY